MYNGQELITSKTEVTPDNLTHKKTYTYDGLGRTLKETTYSFLTNKSSVNNGNKTIQYGYNAYNGILEQLTDVATTTVLWKLNAANEKMQALSATLGNGMQITNTYDTNDYVKTINHSNGTNTALNLEYQFKGDRGTLDYRKNTIAGVLSWNETFVYDSFERLNSWTDPTGTASNTYETDGRIKTNNLVGTYNYDTTNRYQKQSASLNENGQNLYETRPRQRVTYNMFKNPTWVDEDIRGQIHFEFNLGNSRNKSIVMTEMGAITKTKYYSGISTVEIIEKPNQTLQFITYIAGSPYDATVALEKTYTIRGTTYTPSTQEYLYLHRDYQGTILAISGDGGIIKERRQFDPWGVLKKYYKNGVEVDPSTFSNVDFEFLTDRGYTGHEHFFSVGIIHMNGRIYDPVLRTFLSPDPVIQDSNNSQNYNRYAYCWNNPLKYTDPSGNFVFLGLVGVWAAVALGAVIGGVAYMGMAFYTGSFSWGGLAKSILTGAASGAASFGIGELAQSIQIGKDVMSIGSQILRQGVSAIMHGISQGFIQGVSGGNLGQSFLTAAISSIVAGGYGMLGDATQTGVGQALFGTIAGGVTSRLQGGNFWEGAAMGLTVSLLNHVAHQMEMKEAFNKSQNGKKEYVAVVTGESSNNELEAEGIGETIIHRATLKSIEIEEGFLNKLGGKAQYNAIGETDYNNIMKQSLSELMQAKTSNPYYLRIKGALTALYKATVGLPGITNGAYFWNATWQKNMSNIGSNFRALNKGIFEISAEIGQTTFFKYSNSNKHWP